MLENVNCTGTSVDSWEKLILSEVVDNPTGSSSGMLMILCYDFFSENYTGVLKKSKH
jgi:hypothetical protein